MAKILVVDDDSAFRQGLVETLVDLGFSAIEAGNVHEALIEVKKTSFDVMFIDFRMPMINGLEGMKMIRAASLNPELRAILITADTASEITIDSMKQGAYDLMIKPVTRQKIADVLKSALSVSNSTAPESVPTDLSKNQFIGRSDAIKEIQKLIGKVSTSSAPVMITGETGTGKEVVAKSIHRNSERSKGPFVAINCAAIPENLLESELFGHVRGAFTGASEDRLGSFRQADKGTLFLDEIGDMALPLQAKILRSLQEQEITPVGASKPYKIDVRIISATHQNLSILVHKKKFREDLFYRLNVIEFDLPALRDRPEDISELTHYFLNFLNLENKNRPPKYFTNSALEKLTHYSWPGNVRELQNVIERSYVFSRTVHIDTGDLRFMIGNSSSTEDDKFIHSLDLPSAVADLEKSFIERALKQAEGNRSEAARLLGIQRQLLYTKMKELRINQTDELS